MTSQDLTDNKYLFIPCIAARSTDKAKLTKLFKKLGYQWWHGRSEFSYNDYYMTNNPAVFLALGYPYKGILWSGCTNYHDLFSSSETTDECLDGAVRVPTLDIIMNLANGDPEIGFNMFIQQAEKIILEFEEMCNVSATAERPRA